MSMLQLYSTRYISHLIGIFAIAALLSDCSSSSSGGSTGGTGTEDTTTEIWYGAARLQQCDNDIDMEGMFPAITFMDYYTGYRTAFVTTKTTLQRVISYDSNGVKTGETLSLKAIYYDGAVFFDLTDSDPTNDTFAPTSLTVVNPPASGNLLHLEFGNVPTVTVGSTPNVPVVDAGGIIMSDDGVSRPHAFLYIHDKYGCDLVIAGIQKTQLGETGDEPLPSYSPADFGNTSWMGISEEFLDETTPDTFPLMLTWLGERNWELNYGTYPMITGGTGVDDGNSVTITGGDVLLEDYDHGFFNGTLMSDAGNWTINGFMTPDKMHIVGFAWLDDWTGRWHDLSLKKQ